MRTLGCIETDIHLMFSIVQLHLILCTLALFIVLYFHATHNSWSHFSICMCTLTFYISNTISLTTWLYEGRPVENRIDSHPGWFPSCHVVARLVLVWPLLQVYDLVKFYEATGRWVGARHGSLARNMMETSQYWILIMPTVHTSTLLWVGGNPSQDNQYTSDIFMTRTRHSNMSSNQL